MSVSSLTICLAFHPMGMICLIRFITLFSLVENYAQLCKVQKHAMCTLHSFQTDLAHLWTDVYCLVLLWVNFSDTDTKELSVSM